MLFLLASCRAKRSGFLRIVSCGPSRPFNPFSLLLVRQVSMLASTHRLQTWDELTRSSPENQSSHSVVNSTAQTDAASTLPNPQSVLYHSTAHLLGWALESHYGDDCLLTNGPATDQGFFYDSLLIEGGEIRTKQRLDMLLHKPITQLLDPAHIDQDIALLMSGAAGKIIHPKESDLELFTEFIEKVSTQHLAFTCIQVTRDVAARMFAYSPFKLSYLSKIPASETVSLYRCGDFIDLCRGPHVLNTKAINKVKLLHTGASQWQTVSPHSLSRVSGISFSSGKALREWTLQRQEASKRDHRLIGQKQSLFYFSPLSLGAPFFLPHGTRIIQRLTDFLRHEYRKYGFDEIVTPLVFNKSLWEKSGHWKNYKEDMFAVVECCSQDHAYTTHSNVLTKSTADQLNDADIQALKPMNCPGHCLLFSSTSRSYRDLPIRYAEFSPLHRNEASGALTGLTRVRKFHQDDGHIFCTPSQIAQEIQSTLKFIDTMYTKILHFPQYTLALSTRPESGHVGTLTQWEAAETALKEALTQFGKPWTINHGDGAFYGPKIDIKVRDAIGRDHQTATVQLDFQLPKQFQLQYSTGKTGPEDAAMETPVMIHRAVLGSVERMLAILAEHYGGKWPFWMSPRQAIVIPTNKTLNEYAQSVKNNIANPSELDGSNSCSAYYHIEVDDSDHLLSKRVREAQLLQFNYILVVGDKEQETGTVNVRSRTGKQLGLMTVDQLRALFAKNTQTFTLD
ncbi:hypothetical protein O5D80_004399 [Batrachochytrium dendrobatidis]|nr:hypothetical protein O5D80_004399 [Batrachochytrium dendrobatidis]